MGLIKKNLNRTVFTLVFMFLTAGRNVRVAADPVATDTKTTLESKLILRVLGPDHRPVAGAKVGTGVNLFEDNKDHPPQTITMWLRGRKRAWPFITDVHGEVFLAGIEADHQNFYAFYDVRGWVGYLRMRDTLISGRADILLEPACRVHGQITSSGLDGLGLSPYKTTALLYDSQERLVMYFVSDRGHYEFLLPSGSYEVEYVAEGPDGVESQRQRRDLTVARGQRESDMGSIDLLETPLAALLGKRAPGLASVQRWKRGELVQLDDFKGQVVVLVFWASWSQASLKTMPRLIELYDLYQDQGLVIVAVHDNSVTNGQDLEKNLIEARLRYWGRRELPFFVGLDGGRGRGTAHEAYGIEEWPTTVVIGTDGKVAGLFHPWGELQREIPKLLEQAGQTSTYSTGLASTASR